MNKTDKRFTLQIADGYSINDTRNVKIVKLKTDHIVFIHFNLVNSISLHIYIK